MMKLKKAFEHIKNKDETKLESKLKELEELKGRWDDLNSPENHKAFEFIKGISESNPHKNQEEVTAPDQFQKFFEVTELIGELNKSGKALYAIRNRVLEFFLPRDENIGLLTSGACETFIIWYLSKEVE